MRRLLVAVASDRALCPTRSPASSNCRPCAVVRLRADASCRRRSTYTRWERLLSGGQVGASIDGFEFRRHRTLAGRLILRNSVSRMIPSSSWTMLGQGRHQQHRHRRFRRLQRPMGRCHARRRSRTTTAPHRCSDRRPTRSRSSRSPTRRPAITTTTQRCGATPRSQLIDYAHVARRAADGPRQLLALCLALALAVGRVESSATCRDCDRRQIRRSPIDRGTDPSPPICRSSSACRRQATTSTAPSSTAMPLACGMDVLLMPNVFVRGEYEYVASRHQRHSTSASTARARRGIKF